MIAARASMVASARGSVSTSKRRESGDGERTYELATIRGELAARPVVSLIWEGGSTTLPLPESDPCTIGRASDADLVIDARSVSRRHAQLHQAGGLAIEDLGSANGTRVRGRTLSPGERVPVEPNEPVMIGNAILVVRPSGALVDSSAAPEVRAPRAPRAPDSERGGVQPSAVSKMCSLPPHALGEYPLLPPPPSLPSSRSPSPPSLPSPSPPPSLPEQLLVEELTELVSRLRESSLQVQQQLKTDNVVSYHVWSQIAPCQRNTPCHSAVTFSLLLYVQALEGIAEHVDANTTSLSDATSKLRDVTSALHS